MTKALSQLFVLLIIFFTSWFLLSKIDFMKMLKVEHYSKSTEKKLGQLIYESVAKNETEVFDSASLAKLEEIKIAICTKNDLDTAGIKIHLIKNKDVNAFSLPDGHLIIYTGLVAECDNAEELAGAVGHEIVHIEHHHVMKKLLKEVGLSAIITATAGRGGAEILKQLAKLLSSSAYDRTLETDADMTSVDYMCKANIDPKPFANLLYKLGSDNEKGVPKEVFWVTSHPESEKRAKEVLDYLKTKKVVIRPLMVSADWDAFKSGVAAL